MNEIIKRSDIVDNLDDLQRVAKLLAASGYFEAKGSTEQAIAQLATKVLAGREMGFSPFASVNGIHVIQGKPTVSAQLMAAAVKGSAKYDYRIREMTELVCKIEFFERVGGKLESLGVSTFTAADAKLAGTQNMAKYARNMLFARAMSNGVRWYCPDVFASGVYTPEEMGATVDGEGEIIESSSRVVNGETGEITRTPEPEPLDLTKTPAFKKMHALGRERMGDAWRSGEGRDFLKNITGKESTKELTPQEIANVIDALESFDAAPGDGTQDVLFEGPAKRPEFA